MAETSDPGSNCKHGCHFGLCPYPPKGDVTYRIELSEAFLPQAAGAHWRRLDLAQGGTVAGDAYRRPQAILEADGAAGTVS